MRIPDSIPAQILSHTERFAEREALVFLERGERESESLTYEALVAEVAKIAGRLVAEGLSGQPVMIALPAGTAFTAVFLACLWARAAAVPAPYATMPRALDRLRSILADARPAALVTDEAIAARLKDSRSDSATPRVLIASGLAGDAEPISPIAGVPDAPALIQYTSGSTSAPRGVVITHENLFANQQMIRSAFRWRERRVVVSWLPHFHDMGLLGGILQPLFIGGSSVVMDPLAFIQKPIRWLRAISRYGATSSGGPCFAFDLCARQIRTEDIEGLDLSSWRVAFCGAEPVRKNALDRFCERTAPARFDPGAVLPCYGLAEGTLIVSSTAPGEGVRELAATRSDGLEITAVSCGPEVDGCTIRIFDEAGGEAPAGRVGEICISGPHVSPGLWNAEAGGATPFAEEFTDADGRRFLRTGDVGALVNGELVPVDRIKDTIIVYGRKLHAAEVESSLLAAPQAGDLVAACAFSVDNENGSAMVILCEMERQSFKAGKGASLAVQLRGLIGEVFGVLPILQIVPYGSLPRTTSGKIQRSASRTKYLDGEFNSDAAPR